MMASANGGSSDQEWLEYLRKGLKSDILDDKNKLPAKPAQPNGTPSSQKKPPFEPQDRDHLNTPSMTLPDELWLYVLQCSCTFPSEVFHTVMLNLVKNPNITSSHLFRADIFYDSEQDHLFQLENTDQQHGLAKHLKEELRPIPSPWPGFHLERTLVRQLVPRNPQLDKPLVQTCHFLRRTDNEGSEQTLVVYIPHVKAAEEVPFYHPTVSQLAFLHTWRSPPSIEGTQPGQLTVLYRPFPTHPLSNKLSRTALKLLQTIHKHGQGQLLGYEKRVHLDQIIPQKAYQDTYTRLKTKYGKHLAQSWVEVTDPGKHVFEDIAIAAFLVELWRGMYRAPDEGEGEKPPFPGFVDIGCGNGILVYILLSEGYDGWGFDARRRKTWSTFPPHIQERLEQRILVPGVLQENAPATSGKDPLWHDGDFGKNTFIVSNHADELTPWTPLLAHLNSSGFIAIPCCSHDLSGARFRAPATSRGTKEAAKRLPQQEDSSSGEVNDHKSQAAETGSLKRTEAQKKMPSAYSTLCSYVANLATDVGFQPEQEVLRIPSTRNTCIVGRKHTWGDETMEERQANLVEVIERELKRSITSIARDWIEQAQKLMKKPSSGH